MGKVWRGPSVVPRFESGFSSRPRHFDVLALWTPVARSHLSTALDDGGGQARLHLVAGDGIGESVSQLLDLRGGTLQR